MASPTPDELRMALDQANSELLSQALRINDLQLISTRLAKIIARVCELHLAGGWVELNAELERLATNYQQQKAVLCAVRKVH